MTTEKLATLHRQLGNKIVEFKDGKVYGYEILSYENYMPKEIKLVATIENPSDKVLSADTAYDRLFGTPQAPNFTKVLN